MGLDVGEIGMGADLSLDLKMFAAKSLGRVRDAPAAAMDECIRRLEEEKSKIEVFRRELPLCARLLADVIDVMKKEVEEKRRGGDQEKGKEDAGAGDKSNWMSTAQLWTGDSGRCDDASEKQAERGSSSELKSNSGQVLPFKAVGSGAPAFVAPSLRNDDKAYEARMLDLPFLSPAPARTSPAAATGGAEENRRQVVGFAQEAARAAAALPPAAPALNLQPQSQQTAQQQQQARKARRCWSPELHRQFVTALHQLGGPQVATPKQIRELMKVDGLTNDEVKSHLQKYRLHNRRTPGSPIPNRPIVLMGGLWITQEQSSSQSAGSPPGPLHFSNSGVAVSSAATVSGEEEDGRSESYSWK
ncbi:transcription factor NIGTH1 [Lolium perenne]|uniref:transcription factor NIGTH1 n=1 Tax=Lolium perenne TaxID=4522 RepID=UPI0021F69C7F|nr:transcription factor NIGTH1-like [Lolium perenne]